MTHQSKHYFKQFLIAVLFVAAAAQPIKEVTLQMFQKAVEMCRSETGATASDFDAMVRREGAASMAAKCMRACLMKEFGVMDANGKFNREIALQIASYYATNNTKEMRAALEIVDICYAMQVSDNHCEAAEQYGKCANDRIA